MRSFIIGVWEMVGRWLGMDQRVLMGPPAAFLELARACGDANVALFVQKLDAWCAHNANKNSLKHYHEGEWWSFNSYPQWATDLGMGWDASKTRRVILQAEELGVVIGVQRKPGKPKWYRVDEAKLIELLVVHRPDNVINWRDRGSVESARGSVEFGRHINSIKQKVYQLVKQSANQSSSPPSTLDGDDKPKKNFEAVDEDLSPRLVAKFGQARVREAYKLARDKGADNPGGYAAVILEGKRSNPFTEHIPSPPRERTVPQLVKPKGRHEEEWERAHGQLQLQLDRGNLTWLEGAEYVRMDGGRYVIRARNDYARQMCQHRLYANIRRVLSDVVGREVELVFVADEAARAG